MIVGQGRLQDVVLTPGNNTVDIRATLDLKTMIKNLGTILAAEAKSLANGNLMVSASGNSTIYNGQHVTYYETVLNNLTLTGEVSITQLLAGSLSQFLGNGTSIISGFLGGNGSGGANLTQILGGLNMSALSKLGSRSLDLYRKNGNL